MIIHKSNVQISIFLWVSLGHSITEGFAELIFSITWHPPRQELFQIGELKCFREENLSRLAARVTLPAKIRQLVHRDRFVILM